MNTLVIEKQTGGYFKFTLNGDTANAITSIQNDLLAVGTQLHFKTGNGANIIKEQFIYPADVTIIASGTFTFTTVAQVWDKLIDIDYFAWLGGGGTGGVDRFDDLLDTFSYTGNAGKAVVVDGSELRLVPITLYNKRLFTELEDTPSSLVPNKMLVVNPAGTAVVLQDQPEQPEQLLNSVGYFDYNDLITQTTPLNAVANVALKLTNDTEGANTSTDQNPYGVSYVWDYTTNAFNFSELEVGDTIDVRVHVQVTTTSANQRVLLSAKLGIGSVAEFTNIIYENQFKSAGLHEINFVAPFYMGSTYITDNPAELYLTTDSSATVKVDGWYVRILRKNINIITVDYTVPDATGSVKGIVRLAGDLGGTANSPTVPELANKVPTSRTVSTTSPLLGGGALSSNLTLSIQQGGSTQNGYLSSTDWGRFDEAHRDRIVSAAVTGTTTKTLTLTQHDAGTITTSWTDDNTDAVSSVFGRTGAVVSATGDYTTTQVTEGTNLYYTNTRVSANTDVAANTAARHSAVTIGTANGLSLASQTLSLALASTTTTGALSSANWNTFNDKQNALSGTGIVKSTAGVISYLTDNTANWDDAYNNKITTAAVTGTATKTLTLTQQDGGVVQASWTDKGDDLIFSSPLVNTAGTISIPSATGSVNGYLSSTDWTTFNSKQGALNGTGFVKVSGTTISYDNSVYALDSVVVKLTGDQAIAGIKTFSSDVKSTAFRLTGGTAGTGLYYGHTNKVVLANYAVGGGIDFETNGGAINMVLDASANLSVVGSVTSSSIIKVGGTSTQFLKADGSVDSSTYALTSQLHDAVTIGTANGLSLSGQVLSLALASPTTRGALTSEDYNYFFDKVQGNGNQNYIPKYIFSGSNKVIGNSLIYDNGTNIGIGTTNPALSNLVISPLTGNGTVDGLTVIYHPDGGSNRLRAKLWINDFNGQFDLKDNGDIQTVKITSNGISYLNGGNVGIGTTTDAGYKLDVNGTGRFSGNLQIEGSSYPAIQIKGGSTGGGGIRFLASTDTYAELYGEYESANNGMLLFRTRGAGTVAERMRITSGGDVGIGTTSPAAKLDVINNATYQLRLASSSSSYASGGLYLGALGTADANYYGYMRWIQDDITLRIGSQHGNSTGGITFFTGEGTAAQLERMRITSGGVVRVTNLAGTGTRFVTADASGNLSTTTDGAVTSYNSTLTLNTSWQNTGIDSTVITTSGVYLVTCFANDNAVGGAQYSCTYVGTMYFYASGTNGVNANEIALHHSGHADNGRYIYLRTLGSLVADSKLYLQIKGNGTNTGNSTYVFTFKKLL